MGEVYLAFDFHLKREVALKLLPRELALDPQRMSRFVQEARLASRVNHPNAIHIYEVGQTADVHFIAMEYVKGETVRTRLATGKMELPEVLDVACQIASALVASHEVGVVHRDIKTANVIMGADGYAKVLDFGLAKPFATLSDDVTNPNALTVSEIDTAAGVVMGTISYMSPEQLRGLPVDARTDIWSLGVVLYEMIAGQKPFEAASSSDVIAAILTQEPLPLLRFLPGIPEDIEKIVKKALAKQREKRYQTAKALLTDLQKSGLLLKNHAVGRSFPATTPGAAASGSASDQFGDLANNATGERTISIGRVTSRQSLVDRIHHPAALAIVIVFFCVAGLAVAIFKLGLWHQPPPASRTLRRLTFDSGLQCGPTWSPDGRLIAYASERKGNFDIWVQQTDGGNPVQVTTSPAHDWQPDWSPDGKSIIFRSEREGGGLFIVPSFGGTERKFSSFGDHPRWSPDGSKILFLKSGQRIYDYPKVYVASLSDAQPHEIDTLAGQNSEGGVTQRAIGWYPDGQRISFLAMDGTFWTIPIAGGPGIESKRTPAVDAQFKQIGVRIINFLWSSTESTLYLEGMSKGVLNLWKVEVDPQTLKWIDGPTRLTTGIGPDTDIAVSRDGKQMAFVSMARSVRIWSLPFDADSGQIKGHPEPLTSSDSDAWFVDLSRDGKNLVYSSHKYGMDKQQLWEKTLADGRETLLAEDMYYGYFPRWSPDSKHLAYSRFKSLLQDSPGIPPKGTGKVGPIVLLDPKDGQEQFLTSPGASLDYMSDWSPDGRWILGSTNRDSPDSWTIDLFPVSAAPHAETGGRVLASIPGNSLWHARFSPNGRFICFIAQKNTSADASIIYIIPAEGGQPMRITEPDSWADWPRWSPNGAILYFVSNLSSSFVDVYGIRFDARSGKPISGPFRVTNFDSPSRLISSELANMEMSMTKNRLALPIVNVSGSIWVLDGADR